MYEYAVSSVIIPARRYEIGTALPACFIATPRAAYIPPETIPPTPIATTSINPSLFPEDESSAIVCPSN
jgi:hypothetical protein